MGIKSTFRSTMTRTGRDEGVPEEDVGRWPWLENRFVLESRMWSLSLRSNFAAIISAGPPLGHRMIGIEPVLLSARFLNCLLREPTHGYYYTEETTDYPLD